MNIDLIIDEIILGDNTLSEEGKEEIIYELIDIHSRMPQPVEGVGIMTFVNLPDKDLVLTLVSAYQADAVRHFLKCGINPSKIAF